MTARCISRVLLFAMVVSLFAAMPASAPVAAADVQADSGTPIYLDPSYSFEERAADLVSRMRS